MSVLHRRLSRKFSASNTNIPATVTTVLSVESINRLVGCQPVSDQEPDVSNSQRRAATLQMEYNILAQEAADSFARAKSADVGVISRMPLKRGFLSGKIDETYSFAEGDRRKKTFTPENVRKLQGKLDALRGEADSLGISPAAAAIRFCVSNQNVSCVLPGIRTADQAVQNARCGESLPVDVVQRLQD